MEARAVVAGEGPGLWRFENLNSLNVALSSSEKAGQSMKDAERDGLVDGAEVGPGFFGPGDHFGHSYLPDS